MSYLCNIQKEYFQNNNRLLTTLPVRDSVVDTTFVGTAIIGFKSFQECKDYAEAHDLLSNMCILKKKTASQPPMTYSYLQVEHLLKNGGEDTVYTKMYESHETYPANTTKEHLVQEYIQGYLDANYYSIDTITLGNLCALVDSIYNSLQVVKHNPIYKPKVSVHDGKITFYKKEDGKPLNTHTTYPLIENAEDTINNQVFYIGITVMDSPSSTLNKALSAVVSAKKGKKKR